MGGALPLGSFQKFNAFQHTVGIIGNINYAGLKQHNITFGTGFNHNWITDARNQTNAIISPPFIQQIPLTDISAIGPDRLLTATKQDRTNYYALIQDEWNFATDWYLTTGFRYDYYSDTSPGYSPRVALVYNVSPGMTSKLLYSRSFRPPSFLEKYQPATAGAEIKPETANTVEFQVENKWSTNLKTAANVYWFQIDNLITQFSRNTLTPVGSINTKSIEGVGVELESHYKFQENLDLSINYSFHGLSRSTATGFMPEHMMKMLLNWEFNKDWVLGVQLNWIGERRRSSIDQRTDLPAYLIPGLTLRTKVAKPVDITFRVNNLFNENAREPSLDPQLSPDDTQVLGRTFLGQMKWAF